MKHPSEVEAAYDAAQKVVRVHERVATYLRVGQTLAEIDRFVGRQLEDLKCKSCFLGYRPGLRVPKFPSHACLSVNECVVHGTAGYYLEPMKAGDLLKVDVGVSFRGWIGDAAWTYSFGEPEPTTRRLMECGKESLRRGVLELHPKNTYLAWAEVVQGCVEGEYGFHLIRGLGGHGIGKGQLHGPPFVSNVVPTYAGEWAEATHRCEPGTLVAVEPMIAVGTGKTREIRNDWPVLTADGSLSVHYEHDVLITEDGPRVMTEGLERVPDVIGV
ncbi:MAG: type I methionyl aminopeptidase [Phycisphaeraceae bacterium]|nr:MAG: type I methionyl aminopeptidase [Phycisphaeraceae bacterium]